MTATKAWHVPDDELRRYADGGSRPPWLWSVEAHVTACQLCRERLAAVTDPVRVDRGWARLDAGIDAPRPGWIERCVVRIGVADHTARLLAATPVLRLSWFAAVTLTLALTALAAQVAGATAAPRLFLAVAPVLPLVGVVVSFGSRLDPSYELAVVSPFHTFRLLLLRCAAVLTVTTSLSAVSALAVPGFGLTALGWFVPSLVLTIVTLMLSARVSPGLAAVAVGSVWIAAVTLSTGAVLLQPTGQAIIAAAGVVAATGLIRVRSSFDTDRRRTP